jgi:hypothetical protein
MRQTLSNSTSQFRLLNRYCILFTTLLAITPGSLSQPAAQIHTSPPGRIFYVWNFQPAAGKSQFDVAKDTALAWIASTSAPAVLQLGDDIYTTCTGVQMPTSPIKALSIVGQGKGEMGKGTTIKASCSLKAIINYPALPSGNWWSNVEIAHLTLDGNDQAQSCMDLEALRVSRIEDISCTKAIGDDHWVQIGDPNPPKGIQSTGFQIMVDDLFVFNNATAATQWAHVQPSVQAGSLSGYSVTDGGLYRQKGTAPVQLIGYGAGSQPCKVMPTGVLAHLEPDPGTKGAMNRVASITQDTPGSGCTDAIYAHVLDIPKAKYGIQLAITDSTLKDLTVDTVGTTAAIASMIGGANVFLHAHAWQSPVLFQTAGNDVWIAPECDLAVHYCFVFKGRYSSVTDPIFYWSRSNDPAFQGSGSYFSDVSGSDTQISSEDCGGNLQDSGGFQQFVAPEGPLELGSQSFAKRFAVLGGRSCHSATHLPQGVSVESARVGSAEQGVLLNGELHNFSVATLPGSSMQMFLIANLPTANAAAHQDAAVAIRLLGGAAGGGRYTGEFTFTNNGSSLSASQTGWGDQAAKKYAGVQAFTSTTGGFDLYLFVGPGHAAANVTVEMPSGPATIYANPELKMPTGRQVFSSLTP